jgi:hypothetical protein
MPDASGNQAVPEPIRVIGMSKGRDIDAVRGPA